MRRGSTSGTVGDSSFPGLERWPRERGNDGKECAALERTGGESCPVADADVGARQRGIAQSDKRAVPETDGEVFAVANTRGPAGERDTRSVSGEEAEGGSERLDDGDMHLGHRDGGGSDGAGSSMAHAPRPGQLRAPELEDDDQDRGGGRRHDAGDGGEDSLAGPTGGFWRDCVWIPCRDGKARPAQSIASALVNEYPRGLGLVHSPEADTPAYISPLIVGAKARVGRLKAYGNSLCAEAAINFISAYMEATDVHRD